MTKVANDYCADLFEEIKLEAKPKEIELKSDYESIEHDSVWPKWYKKCPTGCNQQGEA